MSPAVFTLIIIAIAIIMFLIPKIQILFTSMFAMLALYFAGVYSPAEMFSGFNSIATWVLIGISMFSGAFFSSGLGNFLGKKISNLAKGSEQICIVVIFAFVTICSGFVNGLAVFLMFMPLLDAVSAQSGGKIKRKNLYTTMAVASLMGGNLSIMGASSILATSGMLEATEYGKGFSFFETAKLAIPMCIICLLFYIFIGKKLMDRVYTFKENDVETIEETKNVPDHMTKNMWITLIVLIVSVVCMVFTKLNMGAICFTATAVMIALKVVSTKEAINSVPWEATVMMICLLGFAKGVEVSGAGDLVAAAILNVSDTLNLGAYGVCVLCLLAAILSSNFMSNSASVVVVFPIAIALANQLGVSPLPFAVVTAVGANSAIATPLCAPLMTMTLKVGYRFKDYLLTNGLLNIATFIVTCIALKIFYF